MSTYPSKRTLEQAFPGHGAALRGLFDGTVDPLTYPSVKAWAERCYNYPKRSELMERALDAEIGGHGIESVRGEKAPWDAFYCDTVALYVNTGDTYAPTLLFDVPLRRWSVTDIGTFVERKQRTYGII